MGLEPLEGPDAPGIFRRFAVVREPLRIAVSAMGFGCRFVAGLVVGVGSKIWRTRARNHLLMRRTALCNSRS
jgi:hypothetical protein